MAFTSLLPCFAICMLTACKSTYYNAWESLGYHKRDILVERVEKAQEDQLEAKKAFASALDEFSALVQFEGGELRTMYDSLNEQLENCRERAEAVTERIASIESVASELFEEWEAELEQYESQSLRTKSEQSLRTTRESYNTLIAAMRRAEAKMPPVLSAFNDQVLFLKHNLNAQAIASLQSDVNEMERDVAQLIAEMNAAIAEADSFIAGMTAP
jgi:hypothetical protein